MLRIPESVKTLFKNDGTRKNFRVHFPNGEYGDIINENVVQESMKFTESLCSQNVFRFGLAESSVLEFETVGVGNMYGMTIEAGIEIDCSSLSAADKASIAAGSWDGTWNAGEETFSVPLGVFRVESCPRDHQNMAHRQVTAYSAAVKTPRFTFPQRMVWPTIYAKITALAGAALGGLPVASTDTFALADSDPDLHPMPLQLFDSDGQVYVDVLDADNGDAEMLYGAFGGGALCSVAMSDYNAAAYSAFGVAVAEAITNAGYDITFDGSGGHRFESNEEALRAAMPWLFAPCMPYAFGESGTIKRYTMAVQPVKNGELFPFIHATAQAGSLAPTETGFRVDDTEYILAPTAVAWAAVWAYVKPTGNNVKITLTHDARPPIVQTVTAQVEGYLRAVPTITRYNLAADGKEVTVKNTGANTFLYGDATGLAIGDQVTEKTGYNYEIAANTILALYNGAAELEAKFIKSDRRGGFEAVRLDNSAPVEVAPGDYAECWWDEYDVEPIGTVIVTYQSEGEQAQENTTAVSIGAGMSEYDMSGNEILRQLSSASLADVTAMVNAGFAPYAGAVAFTPAELTMQGWPWVEAGDALEITAEDGTVVETYALRIEMHGILHLTATITAEGGEIVEEG